MKKIKIMSFVLAGMILASGALAENVAMAQSTGCNRLGKTVAAVGRKTGKSKSSKKAKKTQPMLTGNNIEIGDYIYKLAVSNYYNPSNAIEIWSIVKHSKTTGQDTEIVRHSTADKIVTNGKDLYFSDINVTKGIIWKLDLSTDKLSRVTTGKNYTLLGGTDNYLYIGKSDYDEDGAAPMHDLYTYNIKTGEMKKVIDYPVSSIQVENGMILASEIHFEAGNYRFDLLTESGEAVFGDEAVTAYLSHGKVYYAKIFLSDNSHEYYMFDIKRRLYGPISEKVYNTVETKFMNSREIN